MKYLRRALAWLLMVPAFVLLALAILSGAVAGILGEPLCAAIDHLDPTMQPRIKRWFHG